MSSKILLVRVGVGVGVEVTLNLTLRVVVVGEDVSWTVALVACPHDSIAILRVIQTVELMLIIDLGM